MVAEGVQEYYDAVDRQRALHPEWRYGQTLFNTLRHLRPDLATEVRGSLLDPFYVTDLTALSKFCNWVDDHWSVKGTET